ncbi:kinesin-like protein KIN-7I isoform X2 [Drosophila willistoni]|uniref:kinesin-like protein KIN-7I isoform X2 n=1 Tax=Drosophila willistoni TaxID=7260 RepID=UPI000C26D64F|nr:kinesin-like protein KIN-7I isoform X2 [Drosophila willistoni]
MSAKSSIQVCIKVRPVEPGESTLWQVKDECAIQLIDSQADPFVVDYAFDQDTTNQKVFDRMAKHIVHACMQGFNGTIFAYGQTSSGKTYTMMGDNQNPGVMVLAAKEIFKQIANNNDRDYLIRVGYIEIYNEKVYDLLNKKNQDLKIHEAGHGIVNVNCEEVIITSEGDLLQFLCMGNKERTVGETNMNERSSRSHAVFRIIIESRKTDRSEDDAVIQSVLNLVDLAGSERADQTGARGARLKEGAHINKSLLFLSNVINNLAENVDKKYISFRDSKLTRILQASLVGNALTSIICTIKPSISDESQSTLNFAMRAKKVRIKPQVNEVVSDATMMKRLEREIKDLKNRLAEEERKNESQLKVKQLEQRLKTDMLKIITSNSLNNEKRLQKRRRTWCPSASLLELPSTSTAMPSEGSTLKHSQLPKPRFFPISNISHRYDNVPKTINILNSAQFDDREVFVPGELHDFGLEPLDIPAPTLQGLSRPIIPIALTPTASQMGNAHCETLENEVAAISLTNQTSNAKIEDYETELKELKQKIEKLEMENRDLVGLEFEYKNHNNKLQLRENDLLSALDEKETKIGNLQKSLDELSRDMLRNSKEDQMRSLCPELETSCERICNNCQQLEKLLNEYKSDSKTVESINCECEKLRLEIAETRAKLESVQIAFGQATVEVAEKANHCERLSREAATARDDMTFLQGKYDELEQSRQSQVQAIQDLQADYNAIRQKYTELQQSYENLELKSSASAESCLVLQAENVKLQTEINCLKERVEEAQQKLINGMNTEPLDDQFKAQSEELQAKLLEMQTNFNNIQREYDCLSNELMESVQEGDELRKQCHALQEELKQHQRQLQQSGDAESMKSSGVGTECSETEGDLDHELLQHFAKLSESLHEIELKHLSGFSRVFRATNNVAPALKLCLECTEETDLITHQFDNQMDEDKCVYLKGILKQHRFEIIKLNYDGEENDCDLRNHILQLENEIAEKNALIDATERTINDMREQMTNLESALLEKSVIVNKVEDYQRQIESLEKQNAEITMVCEELQVKVKENTLSESFAMSSIANDSNSEQDIKEIVSLNTTVSDLRVRETELQDQLEQHRHQIRTKDETISQLQVDIQELNERCLSMDVQQVELQSSAEHKQQMLDLQIAKSLDDAQRIDQLQEMNADLTERNIRAEKLLNELKERHPNSEIENNMVLRALLSEKLKTALDDLEDMEKRKTEEINGLKLEFLDKLETSESEYRTNMRKYNIEWEESKDRYESSLSKLKESLSSAEAKLESIIVEHNSNIKTLKDEHNLALDNVIKEKHELESLYDESQKMIEKLTIQLEDSASQDQVDQHLELIKSLKNTIQEFEEKDAKQLLLYEQLQSEYHSSMEKLREEKMALQSQFDDLNAETQSLKDTMTQKFESLEQQLEASVQEKAEVLKQSQQLEEQLELVVNQKAQIQSQMNEQLETLNMKLKDLEEQEADGSMKSQQLKEQLETVLNQKAQLQTEKDELLESFNMKLKDLEHERAEASAKSQQLEEQLKDVIEQKAQIQTEKEKQFEAFKDLENELRQAKEKQLDEQQLKASITEKEEALKKSQQLQMQLDALIKQSSQEKTEMEEKIETFNAKLKDLQYELVQVNQKVIHFDDLTAEHEKLKLHAADMEKMIQDLKEKSENLKKDLTTSESNGNELRSQLQTAEDARKAACAGQSKLHKQVEELETRMSSESRQFARQVGELQGSLKEQQIKLNSLHLQKEEMGSRNKELTSLLEKERKDSNFLKEDNNKLKTLNEQLDGKLKLASEMSNAVLQNQTTIERLTEECETLRSTLKTKETNLKAEYQQKDATISSLLSDKRNLEEKLCTLTEIVEKLESQLSGIQKSKSNNSTNMSMDSNVSNSSPSSVNPTLPSGRRSLDRNATVPRKSISFETEMRKNRRIIAHDERRQSYWNDFRDADCMTDPVAETCNCTELDRKLKDCQRELFIRDSQVTALNFELKNHPLKIENGQLKQRLQDEVEKARHEVKRFKQKNQDLISKINAISASASKTTLTSENTSTKTETSSKDTQTESELESILEKTNLKLTDALGLCRLRFRQIKDLEEKLQQNENSDTTNISSFTAGQIGALKAQSEAQKKELSTLREKYDLAKRALHMRRDEVTELRTRIACLEGSVTAPSSAK